MDIKKIIREEIRKILSENYPAGAQFDLNSPWNQTENKRIGEKAEEIKLNLIWSDNSDFVLFKDKSENVYNFSIDSVDKNDFEPYAEREETFEGRDEDGMPMLEFGEWEINEEVLENFVNDNIDGLRFGKGLHNYESGNYNIVMLDDELKQYFSSMARYIEDESRRASFLSILRDKISESEVVDNIVIKKTMDTPTGS